MRFALIFAVLMLSACAASQPVASSPAPQPAVTAPAQRNWVSDLFATAGTAHAPNRPEVERLFGQPDIARQDGAGAALTYRLPTCALMLLFTADARGELRLAEATAGARRAGEAAPTLPQCAEEAAARAPRR